MPFDKNSPDQRGGGEGVRYGESDSGGGEGRGIRAGQESQVTPPSTLTKKVRKGVKSVKTSPSLRDAGM
jgi:hypothetical protein